jgi:hypothetical protein
MYLETWTVGVYLVGAVVLCVAVLALLVDRVRTRMQLRDAEGRIAVVLKVNSSDELRSGFARVGRGF